MTLRLNELMPDQLSIVQEAIRAELANLWTALPCEISSYQPEKVTVSVKPLIKIPIVTELGTIDTIELPIIEDVPVIFSGAGGFTISHPIRVGDECLVCFADRNIDLWWQSGGVQNPFDLRKHSLSDGFAFFRPQSQKKKINQISNEHLEIRNDENTCKIQITSTGEIHFVGAKTVFHHSIEVQGDVIATGDVVGGAISLQSHTHSGVKSGGDKSGQPQ